jgi:hypothetical protein
MEVHFTPDVEQKLSSLAAKRGQEPDELVQDLVTRRVYELVHEEAPSDETRAVRAADRILEIQKRVKPDPEGWTVQDYINHGRP